MKEYSSTERKYLYKLSKRFFDIIFSAVTLILTSPLILTSALAVRLSSPGPAFYRAKRAGLGDNAFYMYKLRTMQTGTDSTNRRITNAEDERITPVGKLLRKFKIDELPQFWNVLIGEMSIVGPRPEDWYIVQKFYSAEDRLTLNVRPGITSLAAVHWFPDLTYHDPPPADIPMQEWYLKRHLPVQIAEAFEYMEKQSLRFDLKLIAHTLYHIVLFSLIPPKQKSLPVDVKAENFSSV